MKSKKNLRFAGAPLNAVASSDGVGVSGRVTMACPVRLRREDWNPVTEPPLMLVLCAISCSNVHG